MTFEHEHDVYRVTEAAKFLRVHPKTVRKMVKAGELASVSYGGVLFVPAWAIDDLLCRPTK